jgi:hypothetical protein
MRQRRCDAGVSERLWVSKVAGDIAQATAWLRAWPEAPRPARSTVPRSRRDHRVPFSSRVIFDRPMATLPELRARAPRHHGREKYSAYTTRIPALGSASLFIKQGRANVSLFIDGRCCRSLPHRSTHAASFLKAALPAGGGASRGDRISEMAVWLNAQRLLMRSYLAVEWSVTNTWLTIALSPVRPLGPGGWRGRSGQQGCQG